MSGQRESEEEEEEEEMLCDECGCELDDVEYEDNDGVCWDCVGKIKSHNVRRKLPSNYEVREVTGNHRKACSDCGKADWMRGDYYVFDKVNPWGTDKFCLDCAEQREWSDDEDAESLFATGLYNRNTADVAAASSGSSMFNIACHTGLDPNRYPTAGTMHIGGLSSAMINPNLRKMTKECARAGTMTRMCPGKIQSFTELGFRDATCNVCCLPADRDNETNGETGRRGRVNSNAAQGRNVRQRR